MQNISYIIQIVIKLLKFIIKKFKKMKQNFNKNSNETISLFTKDKKPLSIKKSAAMNSALLRKYIEENKNPEEKITLQEVEDKILDKLWEYLEYVDEHKHEIKEIEKPLTSNDMKNETDDWSANFVDIPLEDLVNLTKGASYMGIRTLVDLCCAKLACMCMDKSEEEIFNVFNINETLTEEEKQRLREENKWIENNFD